MSTRQSFTKIENALLPGFRNRMGLTESPQEAASVFASTAADLLRSVFAGEQEFGDIDVILTPEKAPYYVLHERLAGIEAFAEAWEGSDLPQIVGRMAETAAKRYHFLDKPSDKTKSGIRK